MITEGIIKTIDYNSGNCTVRIPLYETVQGLGDVILPGRLSILPGIYNGYQIGDLVWIAFEQDSARTPIVIGKILQSPKKESVNKGGVVQCNSFVCKNSAVIPVTTTLAGSTTYDTMEALATTTKALEEAINGTGSFACIPARYNNILTITSNTTTIKLSFETCTKYSSVSELLQALSIACNSNLKLFPVTKLSGNGTISGIYIVNSDPDTPRYKLYNQADVLLYDSASNATAVIQVVDLTRL